MCFRKKEVKMMAILRDLLFYLVFLYIIMMVGYGNRDPWTFYIYDNLKQTYQVGNQFNGTFDSLNMDKVNCR